MAPMIDDSKWHEVKMINGYALFMGYLLMAVRGLGYLVLGWTSVVLLGGFVSVLGKDFWCLTLITLLQTAGVFDVSLNEKLNYIGKSFDGMASTIGVASSCCRKPSSPCDRIPPVVQLLALPLGLALLLALLVALFLALVLSFAVVCGSSTYTFGLFVTTGISLWRLIEHDYGGNAADAANLKPALTVLYSLALFQGVIFCCRVVSVQARWRLASKVARRYKFEESARTLVEYYLLETWLGCDKDPSFAEGRNLVTYAVGLIKDSKLPRGFLSGARILDNLLEQPKLLGQHMLIRQLITGPASSSQVLQKLLQALDSRSPHDIDISQPDSSSPRDISQPDSRSLRDISQPDSTRLPDLLSILRETRRERLAREMARTAAELASEMKRTAADLASEIRELRKLAARIVEHLAGDIRLNQFPQGIQCISSLLETTSEQQDDDSAPSAHYKVLMEQGLLILEKLAADEHNRSLISNAQGLLSKAMAPVSCDLLHRIDHEAWSSIVAASLKLMCRLVTAPGETGTKLRSQILSNKEAINSMERILWCDDCGEQLCILAIKILTQLPKDASPSISTESREKVTKLLVRIFTDNNKDSSIRKLAGQALAMLSDQSESNATIILKANDTVVDDLRKMLLDVKSSTYRISAAEILEHLHIRYTQDDDYLKELEEAMKDVMPKVLREILLCGSTGKGKQTEKAEKEADEVMFSAPNTDIEGQDGGVSQDNDRNNNTSSCHRNDDVDEQHVDRKLQAALLSLSASIFDKLISEGEDLAQLVRKIVPEGPSFSFASKLKEMVERNNKPTANCLRIMKITCRMIISMIKHNASYDKGDMERLMQSLFNASKNMLDLEGFMIFSSTSSDHGALKPVSTLTSLVKEAQKRLERKKPEQMASTSAS